MMRIPILLVYPLLSWWIIVEPGKTVRKGVTLQIAVVNNASLGVSLQLKKKK